MSVFNAEVTYACEAGYKMNGSKTLRCNETGQWDKPRPICQGSYSTLINVCKVKQPVITQDDLV